MRISRHLCMVLSRTREPVPAPIGCIQGLRHGDAALPCSAQLRIQAYLEDQGHWRVFQAARLPVLWSRPNLAVASGEPRRTPQGEGAALASDPEDEDLGEERAAWERRYEKRPSATYRPEVNAAMANVATRLRARSPDDLTQERPAGRARWRPHTGTGESPSNPRERI